MTQPADETSPLLAAALPAPSGTSTLTMPAPTLTPTPTDTSDAQDGSDAPAVPGSVATTDGDAPRLGSAHPDAAPAHVSTPATATTRSSEPEATTPTDRSPIDLPAMPTLPTATPVLSPSTGIPEPGASQPSAMSATAVPTLPATAPAALPTDGVATNATADLPALPTLPTTASAADAPTLPTLPTTVPAAASATVADVDESGSGVTVDGDDHTDDAPVHPMAHLMPQKTAPSEASRKAAELRAAKKAKAKKIKLAVAGGCLLVAVVVGPPLFKWFTNAINESGSTSTEQPAE